MRYASLEELFAPAFLQASDEQREEIKRLAWYSTEFGLMREGDEIKAFGAGLISSIEDLTQKLKRYFDAGFAGESAQAVRAPTGSPLPNPPAPPKDERAGTIRSVPGPEADPHPPPRRRRVPPDSG